MDKLEHIARHMCFADGRDPDERVSGGPNDFALRSKDFTGYAVGVFNPAWMLYQRQANLFMAALEGFGSQPIRPDDDD